MSFGSSVGDCILLAQLAWNTYQGAKKACGEHDELTREVSSLYKVLNRMQKEISDPESLVHKASKDKRQELEEHVAGCEGILRTMDNVLTKFNALTGEQRRGKKLWQKIKFGNGQMKDLGDIRMKLSAHTSAIMMSLNLCSLDSLGRVEVTLGRVEARSTTHGEQLRGIRKALHWVTANMAATSGDGSVWTSYTNDDQTFWRELRRELVKEGYRSSTLQRHKVLIKDYVEELGNRGVFDDIPEDKDEVESDISLHNQSSHIDEPDGSNPHIVGGPNALNYGQDPNFYSAPLSYPTRDDVDQSDGKQGELVRDIGTDRTEDKISVHLTPISMEHTDAFQPSSTVSNDHDAVEQHNPMLNDLRTASGQDDNEFSDTSSVIADASQTSQLPETC